jgi:hypothetical protein
MISFRYHLVTIVVVFLALGIGVLMGTTVVKQSVIDELSRRADNAANSANALRADVTDLNARVRTWEAFGKAAEPLLVQGELTGQTLVLLTPRAVAPAVVDGVRKALRDAGATVAAVVEVQPKMALADQASKTALAQILGLSPSLPANDLSQQAADRLGSRLTEGPAADPATDMLRALVAANFLQVTPGSGIDAAGGVGQAVVVVWGDQTETVPGPEDFYLPFVVSLVQGGQSVAAAESEETTNEFVSMVRRDGTLNSRVLTVDNADTVPGQIALVLGLSDLVGPGLGSCGDFGVKSGTCGLLPQPSPSA